MVDVRELVVNIITKGTYTKDIDDLNKQIDNIKKSVNVPVSISPESVQKDLSEISKSIDDVIKLSSKPLLLDFDNDKAIKSFDQVSERLDLVNDVVKKPFELDFESDTGVFDEIKDKMDSLDDSLSGAMGVMTGGSGGEDLSEAMTSTKTTPDTTLENIANGGAIESIQKQVSAANQALSSTVESSSKLSGVWTTLKDTASGLSNGMSDAVNSISAAQVAIGAAIGLGVNEAIKDAQLDDAIAEQYKGAEKDAFDEFMKSRPSYMSYDERAKSMFKMKYKNINLEQAMGFQAAAEKMQFSQAGSWAVPGASVEGLIADVTDLSKRGDNAIKSNAEDSSKWRTENRLSAYGLKLPTKQEISDAKNRLREIKQLTGDKVKDDKAIYMEAMRAQMANKTKDIDMAALSTTQRMQIMRASIDDLKDKTLEAALPPLMMVTGAITSLSDAISNFPGAGQFIGTVAVFATLSVVLVKVSSGMLALGTGALNLLAHLILLATGTTVTTETVAAQMALMKASITNTFLHPIGAIKWFIGQMYIMATGTSASCLTTDAALLSLRLSIQAAFSNPIGAIKGFIFWMKAASIAAIQSAAAFMVSPVGIILMVAAVVILAYKLGYLTKAFEAFKRSAIGKDLAAGFQYVVDLAIYLYNIMGQVWEQFKSNQGASIIAIFNIIAGVIGTILGGVDKAYSKIKGSSTLQMAIGVIGAGLAVIFGPMLVALSPIAALLLTAIAAYVILKKLYELYVWLKNWLISNWAYITSLPGKIWEYVKQLPELIGKAIYDILPDWIKEGNLTNDQKTNMSNYGIAGWGSDRNEGLIGLNSYVPNVSAANAAGISSSDLPTSLSGASWKAFQEENPDLAKYMKYGTTFYVSAAQATSDYGIPIEAIPPQSSSAGKSSSNIYHEGLLDAMESKTIEGPFGFNMKTGETGIQAGARNVYEWITGSRSSDQIASADSGGLVTKRGLVYVHNNEPIVPAEVAKSSSLLDLLSTIAESGTISTSESDTKGDTYNYNNNYSNHFTFYGSGWTQQTKSEITRFMDSYISTAIRQRQAH